MRIYSIPLFVVIFIGWVLYRWLIKKDIKQHKGDVASGFMFLSVWAMILLWVWV